MDFLAQAQASEFLQASEIIVYSQEVGVWVQNVVVIRRDQMVSLQVTAIKPTGADIHERGASHPDENSGESQWHVSL